MDDRKQEIAAMVYRDGFKRQLSKAGIETCTILGSEVLVGSMQWLVDYLIKNVRELSGDYLTISATNEIIMAYNDRDFFRCHNGGVMSIPDGGPLKTYGQKRGYRNMERITGPDLMVELFKASEKDGLRHYFYGTTQDTLDKMRSRLEKEYPKMQVVGMRPSKFRNLTDKEDKETVEAINATNPDFIWFSLGAPKGNYFAANHQGVLNGFMMSVGAGFDYFAGNIKRAPRWMQTHDLEWLYRVFQDPARMLKRYCYIIPRFLWIAYVKEPIQSLGQK